MRLMLCAAAALLSAAAFSQTFLRTFTYTTPYGGLGPNQRVTACSVTKNGQFMVAGHDMSGSGTAFAAAHYRSGGLIQYIALGAGVYVPRKILVNSAGDLYVISDANSGGDAGEVAVSKISAAYVHQWTHFYHVAAGATYDYASDAVLDSAGNLFIVGSKQISGGNYDAAMWKIDPNGTQLFAVSHAGTANYDSCTAIAMRDDDTPIAVGTTNGTPFLWGPSRLTGAENWYNEFAQGFAAVDVVIEPGTNALIALLNSGGVKLVRSPAPYIVHTYGTTIAGKFPVKMSLVGGKVYVGSNSGTGAHTSRFNAGTLASEWEATYRYPGTAFEEVKDFYVDAAGETYSLLCSGTDDTLSNTKYVFLKQNGATGATRFATSYFRTAGGRNWPSSFGVHEPSGDVFIAGMASNQFASDLVANIGLIQPAIAVSDLYRLTHDTVYNSTSTVTFNDRYFLGAVCSVDTNPTHGTLVLNANRTFRYTPNAGYVGTDTWRYRLTKTGVNTTTGTVTLVVQ